MPQPERTEGASEIEVLGARAGAQVTDHVRAILAHAEAHGAEMVERAVRDAEQARRQGVEAIEALIAAIEPAAGTKPGSADFAKAIEGLRSELERIRAELAEVPEHSFSTASFGLDSESDLLSGFLRPPTAESPSRPAPSEPPPAKRVEPAPPPPQEREPVDQAANRVAASSNDELAERYSVGLEALRRSEREDEDDRVQYWRAYTDAIVREAASRTDFRSPLENEELSRRDRRRLEKQYGPLVAACEALAEGAEPGAPAGG